MLLDEETLQNVARDGEMDYAKWPGIIDALLERLNQIVFDEFPIPRPFPNISRPPVSAPLSPEPQDGHARAELPPTIEAPETQSTLTSTSTSTSTTTATSHPASSQPPTTPLRSLPPVPLFTDSPSTTTTATHVPESLPPSQDADIGTPASQASPANALPAALAQLVQSITTTLRASFSHRPPHTIQRLAELVLEPRKHYKTLPAWLRAVDRVVNVSSSADIFPLSDGPRLVNGVINGEIGGGILWKNDDTRNGSYNSLAGGELGSDESLGGALLTPIPWLRHERGSSIEGDAEAEPDADVLRHGDNTHDLDLELDSDSNSSANNVHIMHGSHQDPLVPDGPYDAVPQGEFIRIEQGAGAVLMPLSEPLHEMESEQVPPDADGSEDEEEQPLPHARGPQVVGAVDMGKVGGKEVEVRIASPLDENDATVHPLNALASGTDTERKAGSGTDGFEFVQRTDIDPMEVDDHHDDDDDDDDDDGGGGGDDDASSRCNLGQKTGTTTTRTTKKQQQQQQKKKKAKTKTKNENEDMVFVGADGSMDDDSGDGRRFDKAIDDEPSNTKAFDALR